MGEDPRQQGGEGQGGYPEANPADSSGGGAGEDAATGTGDVDAPDTSSDEEGDAGQATGNPDAAG